MKNADPSSQRKEIIQAAAAHNNEDHMNDISKRDTVKKAEYQAKDIKNTEDSDREKKTRALIKLLQVG